MIKELKKHFESITYLEGNDYSEGYYNGIQKVLEKVKEIGNE